MLRSGLLVGASVSALVTSISPVAAQVETQSDARTVEVIVVQSQRRDQSINDVPISVTAYGAKEIDAFNIIAIEDYAQITPNLGFTSDGTPLGANINIRGVENIGGIVNSIGIYVDEINTTPSSDIFAYDANLFDIERIEVLRGPQGTLFGRNVLGGVINISTVKPSDTLGGLVDLQYGSFDFRRAKASLNVPVADGFYIRGTFLYEATDGWIDSAGPVAATNDRRTLGGRLAIRFEPTDTTTIDLSGSYSDYEQGLPDAIPSGQRNPFFNAFNIPVDPVGDYADIGFYPENDDTVALNGPFFRNRDIVLLNARAEHDFGGMAAIINVGYIDSEFDLTQDNDYAPTDWFFESNTGSVESLSIEARLQSTGDQRLSWVAGVNYADDESRFREEGFASNALVQFVVGFDPGAPFLRVDGDNVTRGIETWGVFGDVTYAFGDDERLVVSVGGRYSNDTVTDQLISEPNINNGFNEFQLGPASETFETFTARGSVLYKLTDEMNVYATISRGTKPGGFNLFSLGSEAVPDTYGRESLLNYEIGTKGTLADNRVSYSFSLFYMDWSDLQFDTVFVTDETVGTAETITLNAGKASSYGFEGTFAAVITENFDVSGSVGYLVAKLGTGASVAPGIDELGQPFDIDGNRLPRAPRFSFNLAAEYKVPINVDWEGFVRAEGSYRTRQFETISNGDNSIGRPTPNEVPGYGILNLRAGVRSDAITLTVYAENIVNDTEVIGIRPSVSIVGSPFTLVRRQFGVRAGFNF